MTYTPPLALAPNPADPASTCARIDPPSYQSRRSPLSRSRRTPTPADSDRPRPPVVVDVGEQWFAVEDLTPEYRTVGSIPKFPGFGSKDGTDNAMDSKHEELRDNSRNTLRQILQKEVDKAVSDSQRSFDRQDLPRLLPSPQYIWRNNRKELLEAGNFQSDRDVIHWIQEALKPLQQRWHQQILDKMRLPKAEGGIAYGGGSIGPDIRYVMAMRRWDTTLHDVLLNEKVAGTDPVLVSQISERLARALAAVHQKRYIHGACMSWKRLSVKALCSAQFLEFECSASDRPWMLLLCGPYPKDGFKLAKMASTAHFA